MNGVVQMKCSGNGSCITTSGSSEYVVGCDASGPSATHSQGFDLNLVAHADTAKAQMREAGWVVPSISTLDKMEDRERVGYTRFDVSFIPSSQVSTADTYYYAIIVNGEPIYIDGFLPDRMRFPLHHGTINRLSFALENLNFTGQYRGYEKLQLNIVFLREGESIYRQNLDRDYIALRDAPAVSTPSAVGTFTWTGNYVVPKNENKYEILLASSDNVELTMNAKTEFDNAKLSFGQQPVVMVVRPPLRPEKPRYGLALGIILPSSQVQFTFNPDEAAKFCHWAAQQVGHGAGGRLIQPDLNRYNISDRSYTPCSKL
jgi:hypothetical protein